MEMKILDPWIKTAVSKLLKVFLNTKIGVDADVKINNFKATDNDKGDIHVTFEVDGTISKNEVLKLLNKKLGL